MKMASEIDDYFRDVDGTLDKLREAERQIHLGDVKAAERASLSKSEFERLNKRGRNLVGELRETFRHVVNIGGPERATQRDRRNPHKSQANQVRPTD